MASPSSMLASTTQRNTARSSNLAQGGFPFALAKPFPLLPILRGNTDSTRLTRKSAARPTLSIETSDVTGPGFDANYASHEKRPDSPFELAPESWTGLILGG